MDWRFACYDISDDGGSLLRASFPTSSGVPGFVKTAQFPEASSQGWALDYNDGVAELKKFACSSRADAWLSGFYFSRTGHQLPEGLRKTAARAIQESCKNFGVEEFPTLEKIAMGEVARIPIPAGVEAKMTKVASDKAQEAEVRLGAVDPMSLSPKDRMEFYKTASPGFGRSVDQDSLQKGLMIRMMHVPEGDRSGMFSEMSKFAMDPAGLVGAIEDMDHKIGVTGLWDSTVPNPYDTVYGRPKTAAPKTTTEKDGKEEKPKLYHLGQIAVTSTDIIRLAKDPGIADRLSSDFAKEFEKSPCTVFESLPKPTQLMLAQMSQEV